ncbi:hypothetical protein D3C71_1930840 [compost metagenome]
MARYTAQTHRMLAGHQVVIAQLVGRCLDRVPANKHAVRRRRVQEGITDNTSGTVALTRDLLN